MKAGKITKVLQTTGHMPTTTHVLEQRIQPVRETLHSFTLYFRQQLNSGHALLRQQENELGTLAGQTWRAWLRVDLTHARSHFPSRDAKRELFGWDGHEGVLKAEQRGLQGLAADGSCCLGSHHISRFSRK